jgi:carbon monoxide dehydrogenase subunit G
MMVAMELTRRFRVPTTLDRVWEAFSHLERVAPCFPGAVVVATGPDGFRGSVTLKIGPLPLTYAGSGRYLERSAGRRRVVVQAHGEDERGRGGAAARLTTSLHARGAETEVELVTELELTGKPTRYGDAVTAQATGKLLDQFVSAVTERLGSGTLPPLDGSVGGTVAAEVAAPAVDASVPAASGAVPPPVHASSLPRHSDGRPPVGGPQVPRRAQLVRRPPVATLARRYGPVVLTAVGAAALALTVLGRRRG